MKSFIKNVMITALLCIGGTSAAQSFNEFMVQWESEWQASVDASHLKHQLIGEILHGIKVLEESFDDDGITVRFFQYVRYPNCAPFLKTNGANEENVNVLRVRLHRLKSFLQDHDLPKSREEYDVMLGYRPAHA